MESGHAPTYKFGLEDCRVRVGRARAIGVLKGRLEGEFLGQEAQVEGVVGHSKNIGLSPFRQKQIGLPSIAVIRRIGPILGVVAKAMLDRVGPAIVHMGAEIGFVADVMLPKPLLPDRRFVPSGLNRAVT